ncbi:hypothetical protein CASFOL_032851 [Castilleja foliolosa]|uniref:Uncharacterized protein n=1 Tax=Castilleja foliolosa TaxID=1961234 RepID=A0ABD3C2N9_9LAMI
MGTKIQANAFFPEYHSVTDLNGSTSNDMMRSLYNGNPMSKNGPFTAQIHESRYLGYDIAKMRQTILEHESIFKNQLQELHRLYERQRELMSEMKRRKTKKDEFNDKCLPVLLTNCNFSKGTDSIYTGNNNKASYNRDPKLSLSAVQRSQPNSDSLGLDLYFKRTNPNKGIISDDLMLSRGDLSANSCLGFNLVMKDFFQTSPSGKERLSEDYAVLPRKEFSQCPYTGTSVSQKKKKIFGVEISEGDEYPFNAPSNISSTFNPNIEPHASFKISSWVANSCMQNSTADLKGGISSQKGFTSIGLCLGNVSYQGTEINPRKCSKNLDDTKSNQENPKSGLPWFLKNRQASDDVSKMNKSLYIMNLDSLQNRSEKFFGKSENAEGEFQSLRQKTKISTQMVNDSTRKIETDVNVQTNQVEKQELVLHDEGLNNRKAYLRNHFDLNMSLDEDIDLEVLPVIESKVSYEECDKIAAEAIIDISSKKNSMDDDKSCDEHLKWFADIVSLDRSGPHVEIESIPDGMDYFEFMTLKIEDIKEEHCHHEPFSSNTSISASENGGAKMSKRARRGRQRRDFQRDILPGLVTLSRLEVAEDFQAFDELLKGEGPSKQVMARNGRGRKRLGGRNASPITKVVRSGRALCQLEERSLTGWGKRTRRLPRQRCASSFLTFPVKC